MRDSAASDRPLTIGIVGAGEITRKAHLPVLLNIPGVRVAWLLDQRPERAAALAAAHGLPHVHPHDTTQLPACDVALLAIPVDGREQYLEAFAGRGTAVFCEKPFALSAAEHQRVLDHFPAHAVACGFMRRFYRSTILLRHIVASQMFGPLLRIEVHEGNRSKGSGVDSSFLDDPRLGASRGVLMDLGSHSLDLALQVTNARDFEIRACDTVLDGQVDRQVTATVDLFTAVRGAASIDLRYGVSWLMRQTNRIELHFDRVSVWSDLSAAGTVYLGTPGDSAGCLSLESSMTGARTFNQAFYLEWCDFLQGLRAGRESTVSAGSALLTTRLVDALLSFRTAAHD
jgi:predicted dehydrogenase